MIHNTDLLAAGREIRRHRLLRNLSQEQLAERAGLHRNYVGFLERGERNASLTTLFAVSRALEVPLGELFAGLAVGTGQLQSNRPKRHPRRAAD